MKGNDTRKANTWSPGRKPLGKQKACGHTKGSENGSGSDGPKRPRKEKHKQRGRETTQRKKNKGTPGKEKSFRAGVKRWDEKGQKQDTKKKGGNKKSSLIQDERGRSNMKGGFVD